MNVLLYRFLVKQQLVDLEGRSLWTLCVAPGDEPRVIRRASDTVRRIFNTIHYKNFCLYRRLVKLPNAQRSEFMLHRHFLYVLV